jgi:putative endopeptidase
MNTPGLLIATLIMSSSCGAAIAARSEFPPATTARLGSWGVDLTARDLGVRPGDDFFSYANGSYFARTPFAPDDEWIGTWNDLQLRTAEQVREIIQSVPNGEAGSLGQKVNDYYRSYLDVAAIDKAGFGAARASLDAISAARTHEDIARLTARADLGLPGVISIGIAVDEQDSHRYVIEIEAARRTYGLPARDYYLSRDPAMTKTREQYRRHIARMLTRAGERGVEGQAQIVLDLETRLANAEWPREKALAEKNTYNPREVTDLGQLIPGYPWPATLSANGLSDQKRFVLGIIEPIRAAGALFLETPVSSWQSYLKFHFLSDNADVLPKVFDEESFAFRGRILSGQQKQPERWRRAVRATSAALSEAVGKLYVERLFPPRSKLDVQVLAENLRAAFAQRMSSVRWMSEASRSAALEKLAGILPKIGYPLQWRDYSALNIRAGDPLGNRQRAAEFGWQRDLERLGKPTDRDEWSMSPQTINAYYNPSFNEVVFPAAFLQPPWFDPGADAAVNYGAIGATIGHEIGHGFDSIGSQYDAGGVRRTWWLAEDAAGFNAIGDRLATQFDAYEVMPGLKVRGRSTLAENMADLTGLQIAYDAYRLSLKGDEPPVLDGLTGDQRFFLAYAQIWRIRFRDARLRSFVMKNPHAPPRFRVNGIVRNLDTWYAAFNVKPGDRLYLAPGERVRVW